MSTFRGAIKCPHLKRLKNAHISRGYNLPTFRGAKICPHFVGLICLQFEGLKYPHISRSQNMPTFRGAKICPHFEGQKYAHILREAISNVSDIGSFSAKLLQKVAAENM